MKRCSKCGVEKPLDQFYRQRGRKDGRTSHCKICRNAYKAMYRASDKGKAVEDRYFASDNWKAANVRHVQDYARRHPEKYQANYIVGNAVRDGKLPHVSTQPCATCGDPAEHYHHQDYERPLEVTPLCVPCHKGVHA